MLLAKEGTEVDKSCAKGRTALFAAAHVGSTKAVRMLLDAKASVNAQNSNGETPLFVACADGHEAVVRELLHCSDIELTAATTDGSTALHAAVERGSEPIVRLLLQSEK